MRMFAVLLGVGVLFCACSSPRPLSNGAITVAPDNVLPQPTTADIAADRRGYVIGPYDKLSIAVVGMEDLTQTVQVDAGGFISVPIAGPIEAAGKTPGQLEAEVTRRLRAGYVRDPKVAVNATDVVSQTVTVEGDVGLPGEYPVTNRMTLLRAVAAARGTTEFAKLNEVVLFRRVNGVEMAALYDVRAIRKGLYPDPQIYPRDKVVVGHSQARQTFKDLLQGAGILASPLVVLLQARNNN